MVRSSARQKEKQKRIEQVAKKDCKKRVSPYNYSKVLSVGKGLLVIYQVYFSSNALKNQTVSLLYHLEVEI
jgi:hypothetical protein